MTLPEAERRRLEQDKVLWLATVTERGVPAPNPVWFVVDGDDVLVYADPSSKKVANIERRALVTLHTNADRDGGDFLVVTGRASVTRDRAPSQAPGWLDKYHADIVGALATTVEEIDATYNAEIRIHVDAVRGTPSA